MKYIIPLLALLVLVGCQKPYDYRVPPPGYERPDYRYPQPRYDYERRYDRYEDGAYYERDIMREYHNKIRSQIYVRELKADNGLDRVAQEQADWMARVQTLTHRGQDGSTITQRAKEWQYAGENIGYGYRSPQEILDAWIQSENHYKNIVNERYSHVGIGYADANGIRYWCVVFGGKSR
jgi:uncharacterized protein YkwD